MARKKHPIVLRFEGMDPSDIGGYAAHCYRSGGDLGHIFRNKSEPRRLLGTETWAQEALAEIELMKVETFAAELEDLDRRNRRKDLEKRRIEGPRDPWRASRHGPMRELILTANKEWFEHTDTNDQMFCTAREKQFEERAVAWLEENFGDDVIHARADTDEQAYHIHAVIMPRATVRKYGTECQVLQPSARAMIRDYEKAQDSVGEWFSEIGLVRGERHKQAIRDALNDGREPPINPRHVRPAVWRAREEQRLAEKAAALATHEREVADREQQAEEIIAFGEAISAGEIDENGRPANPVRAGGAVTEARPIRPQQKATFGFAIARKAFRAAMKRLRLRAEAEANRKAQEQIATEVAEIKAADEVIVEIGQMLPTGLRARIAKVRRRLSARIMTIDPASTRRAPGANRGVDDPR